MPQIFAKKEHYHNGKDSPRLRFSDLWFDQEAPSAATIRSVVENSSFESLEADIFYNKGNLVIRATSGEADTTIRFTNEAEGYVANVEIEGGLKVGKGLSVGESIVPSTSGLDLGTSGDPFRALYLSEDIHVGQDIYVDGFVKSELKFQEEAIFRKHLQPDTGCSVDLGTSGDPFRALYLSEDIHIGEDLYIGGYLRDHLLPASGIDLGSTGNPFRALFLSEDIHIGQDLFIDGYLRNNLLPIAGLDLGSTGNPFYSIYAENIVESAQWRSKDYDFRCT